MSEQIFPSTGAAPVEAESSKRVLLGTIRMESLDVGFVDVGAPQVRDALGLSWQLAELVHRERESGMKVLVSGQGNDLPEWGLWPLEPGSYPFRLRREDLLGAARFRDADVFVFDEPAFLLGRPFTPDQLLVIASFAAPDSRFRAASADDLQMIELGRLLASACERHAELGRLRILLKHPHRSVQVLRTEALFASIRDRIAADFGLTPVQVDFMVAMAGGFWQAQDLGASRSLLELALAVTED